MMDQVIQALPFVSEDDLGTFQGWLKYQAIDLPSLDEDERVAVREMFDDAIKRRDGIRNGHR